MIIQRGTPRSSRVGLIAPGHISEQLVAYMHRQARRGTSTGRMGSDGDLPPYERACRHQCPNTDAGLILTRDVEMRTSGWLADAACERGLHLSISFSLMGLPLPHDHATARRWCRAVFGDDVDATWVVGPATPEGRRRGVWHYYLFADGEWRPLRLRERPREIEGTLRFQAWGEIHGGVA